MRTEARSEREEVVSTTSANREEIAHADAQHLSTTESSEQHPT